MTQVNLLDTINKDELADQTVDDGSGFVREPIKIGTYPARMISYIEYGDQPQRAYQGKDKPDALMALIEFELLGKNNVRTSEDGEKTFADRIQLRLKVSNNERSGFRKLLDRLTDGTDVKNMAGLLLNYTWMLKVSHNVVEAKDGKPERTYENIGSATAGWDVGPAVRPILDEDGVPTGETVKINVREAVSDCKFLVWAQPNAACWDSIFIEGEYTAIDYDGKEVTKSKNWIQELCMTASNFEGSPLQDLVGGTDKLAEDHGEPDAPAPEKEAAAAADPDDTVTGDDALAAMGLQ